MDKWNMQGNKLQWHLARVMEWQSGKRIAPILIDIGATKTCNCQCRYCYRFFQKATNEVISGDVLIKLCKDAPLLGIKALTFTGDGEPTLNPAIYEAVTGGKNNGLDIGFATNGIAINDVQNEILMRNLVWCRYNISAATPESYKYVHGVKNNNIFDKVLYNIRKSVEIKNKYNLPVTVGLQMVLIPECINDVVPLSKIAVDYGVDYFVIKQFSDPGCVIPARYDQSKTDSDEWTNILKTAEAMSNDKTQIVVKWPHLKRKGIRPYDRCLDCPFIFQISGNSRCYPCGFLFNNEEYCYGDLKTQSLEEIITSERYWNIIEKMKNFDVHTQCTGACRHDETNAFIWNLLHPPEHINFI
jgi:sulfatase maturation enzyme AslB (radical SAM superfamily)